MAKKPTAKAAKTTKATTSTKDEGLILKRLTAELCRVDPLYEPTGQETEAELKELIKVAKGDAAAADEKKKDEVKTTVEGMRLEITGTCEHSIKGEVEYPMTLELPRREDWKMYLKEAVLIALRKDDANVQSVITHYVDDEAEIEMEVSFIGKNPFELDRAEIFAAKCYYGLRSIRCAEDKRPAQIMMYRQLCKLLGKNAPAGDDKIKMWPVITLLEMSCPAGDTMTQNTKPIKFIKDGDFWIKKVIVEDADNIDVSSM